MSAFKSLTRAMLLGFLRDRMTLFWAVLFPMMFLVLFGGIFNDQTASKLEVDQVGSVELLDNLAGQGRAAVEQTMTITKIRETSKASAIEKVRKGDLDAVVTQAGDQTVVYYSVTDQVTAARVQATFQGLVDAVNVAQSGVAPEFSLSVKQVEDESLSTIQVVTPGLLGWAVAMSATFGAGVNLVAWRKSGLLRRLRLAPVPTRSIVLARVGVSLLVALGQAAIFIGLAVLAFGLKLTGWWPLVIPLVLAGTLAFLSIGLLAGSISKTEEGAVGLANFVVLPMAFLSGSFFPLDGAPAWLQSVSRLLPLRHMNDGMLDVMVRGMGPSAIVFPMIFLLVFAAVCSAISAKMFRWDA